MVMEDAVKIFDDYESVDCNQCDSWWTNTCDGVKKGTERHCTAFKAVRRVDIPLEIERLRKAVKWLIFSLVCLGISQLLHLATHI